MMESRVTFELYEPTLGRTSWDTDANADSRPVQTKKRRKYAPKACHDCKRRKVRCSGEEVCEQCQSRDIRCCYSPPPQAPHKSQQGGNKRNASHLNSSYSTVSPNQDNTFSTSSTTLADHLDPRVNELCDRVRALERILNHLLKTSKVCKDPSSSVTFQTPVKSGVPNEDHDADQFAAGTTAHDDLSLSSQVAAMSALLSRPPSPKLGTGRQKETVDILVEFPEPASLQNLLEVYFRDVDTYFPFLDRQFTETCIRDAIRRLGYSSFNRILVVTVEDLSIIALACIMMALAECLDSRKCDGDTKPGWENYMQSCRAIQRFSLCGTPDLNIVRAQCLVAVYLMHCETLHAASEATLVTWRFATSVRLNNKNVWPAEGITKTLQRQKLWWTIYFLDRQISRRSGFAYHIRDTEFDVDDFSASEETTNMNFMQQNEKQLSITRHYLQALISTARLWGQAWDTFFAVGATKKGDWMEMEIMDARILNTRRQLPKTLTWDSDQIDNYKLNGEDEPHIRRRLHLYTRLELLRMLIRQNPVRQTEFDPETGRLCARLSREIIGALDLFINRYPEARATGYFTTSSIVECIYHLAPVMRYSKDTEHVACVTALNQAYSILVKLSAYNKVARRALKALKGVIRKWGHDNGTGNSTGIHTGVCQIDGLSDCNITDDSPDFDQFSGANGQTVADGFNVNLDDWMNVSMGSLFSHQLDFEPDNQA